MDIKGEAFVRGTPVKMNLDSLTFIVEDSLYEVKEGYRSRGAR